MLAKIAKVQIVGTKESLIETVHLLHKLGVMQIIEPPPELEPEQEYSTIRRMTLSSANVKRRDRIRQTLLEVEGLLVNLPSPPVSAEPCSLAEYEHGFGSLQEVIRDQLDHIFPQVHDTNERINALAAEQATLPYYKSLLSKLTPLTRGIHDIADFDMVALLMEREYKDTLALIRYEVERITSHQFEMVDGRIDEDQIAALIAFPHVYRAEINELLGHESVNEVHLPASLADSPLATIVEDIDERLTFIGDEISRVRAELRDLADTWYAEIITWRHRLQECLAEIDMIPKLWETNYTFVIFGWTRQSDVSLVRDELQKVIGDKVILSELILTPEDIEAAPVIMDNPPLVKPFEFFMSLLAPPRYGTVDPTPYMAFFLPAFFGVIVGDIGYGVVFLALAAYLNRTRKGGIQALGRVLAICGVWTIIFGFIFGEFFGTLGPTLGLHPIWLDRAAPDSFIPLIAMSVIMGLTHVVLGLVLGIVNGWRGHHKKEILEKTGMLVALLAIIILLGAFGGMVPAALTKPALVVLGIALVVLVYSAGIMGPMEIFSTIGNILSYIRIAAIGLSSVFLAEVANELGKVTDNVVLGIVVAGIFHILNIALGMFSPTIHAMRLHFVEFFGKFVEYGTNRFVPFELEI